MLTNLSETQKPHATCASGPALRRVPRAQVAGEVREKLRQLAGGGAHLRVGVPAPLDCAHQRPPVGVDGRGPREPPPRVQVVPERLCKGSEGAGQSRMGKGKDEGGQRKLSGERSGLPLRWLKF